MAAVASSLTMPLIDDIEVGVETPGTAAVERAQR
jgi:hypothetical protein